MTILLSPLKHEISGKSTVDWTKIAFELYYLHLPPTELLSNEMAKTAVLRDAGVFKTKSHLEIPKSIRRPETERAQCGAEGGWRCRNADLCGFSS